MSNKLISQLTKDEILALPGFNKNSKFTVKQLKEQLNKNMKKMQLSGRGLRVRDYINAYKEQDKQYKQTLINNDKSLDKSSDLAQAKACDREESEILNIQTDLYSAARTEARKEYKQRIKGVQNKKQFKNYMKEFMVKAKKEISFDIDIGDDEDKRLAFTETLRHIVGKAKIPVVVKSMSLDGKEYKWFTLLKNRNIDTTIGHIAGTIDLAEDSSDTNPWVANSFIPVKYHLLFLHNTKKK